MALPLDEQDPDQSSRMGVEVQAPVGGLLNMTTPWGAGGKEDGGGKEGEEPPKGGRSDARFSRTRTHVCARRWL